MKTNINNHKNRNTNVVLLVVSIAYSVFATCFLVIPPAYLNPTYSSGTHVEREPNEWTDPNRYYGGILSGTINTTDSEDCFVFYLEWNEPFNITFEFPGSPVDVNLVLSIRGGGDPSVRKELVGVNRYSYEYRGCHVQRDIDLLIYRGSSDAVDYQFQVHSLPRTHTQCAFPAFLVIMGALGLAMFVLCVKIKGLNTEKDSIVKNQTSFFYK